MAAAKHLHVGAASERRLHPHDELPGRRSRAGQLLQAKVAGPVEDLSPHARAHGVTKIFTAFPPRLRTAPTSTAARTD